MQKLVVVSEKIKPKILEIKTANQFKTISETLDTLTNFDLETVTGYSENNYKKAIAAHIQEIFSSKNKMKEVVKTIPDK